MQNISKYIVEKLKINKETSVEAPGKFTISSGNLKLFKSLVDSKSGFDYDGLEKYIKPLSKKERLIELHTDLMFFTNSEPYIFKNEIRSCPANYGKCITDKLLKANVEAQEIFFDYDIKKDYEFENDSVNKLNKYYFDIIESLLKNGGINQNYKITLLSKDLNNYSKDALDILSHENKKLVLPFELILKNSKGNDVKINCEITLDTAKRYYNFYINGKKYKWSGDFYNEIIELIK